MLTPRPAAVVFIAALGACAGQSLDLRPPSDAMLTAIEDATTQERIAPPGTVVGPGFGVGVGLGGGSVGFARGATPRPCTKETPASRERLRFPWCMAVAWH
ncbi:MAG: hypothetical protein AAFW76_11340, partial [Pseudomonadota bacterium]